MSTSRFFVSLDDKGQPLRQRNSVKAKPYLSASFYGDSFSSSPPNGAYPRKVVELCKPIEWSARVTLADGSTVWNRSKSGPVARNLVRYNYVTNPWDVTRNGAKTGVEPKRADRETWTNEPTFAAWLSKNTGLRDCDVQERLFVVGDLAQLRNWPAAGDSIVLPDQVSA